MGLIGFARLYAESYLKELVGVHFVISSVTGIATNSRSKRKDDEEQPTRLARPGLSFIVCYTPSNACKQQDIEDLFTKLGLDIETPATPEFREIPTKSQDGTPRELTLNQCAAAVKDYSTEYVKNLLLQTQSYCSEVYPDVEISTAPVNVVLYNNAVNTITAQLATQLGRTGVTASLISMIRETPVQNSVMYGTSQLKGVDLSLELILSFVREKGFALRRGYVYAKEPGASVTYSRLGSVESFVHSAKGNPTLKHQISICHLKQIISIMTHPDFNMMRQIDIDFDLIEVNDNKCWNLAKMKFEDTPISQEEIGLRTPRAYIPYNPAQTPNPTKFKDTVINSFPDIEQ